MAERSLPQRAINSPIMNRSIRSEKLCKSYRQRHQGGCWLEVPGGPPQNPGRAEMTNLLDSRDEKVAAANVTCFRILILFCKILDSSVRFLRQRNFCGNALCYHDSAIWRHRNSCGSAAVGLLLCESRYCRMRFSQTRSPTAALHVRGGTDKISSEVWK